MSRPVVVTHTDVKKPRVTLAEHEVRLKLPTGYPDPEPAVAAVEALRDHLPFTTTLRGRLDVADHGHRITLRNTNRRSKGFYQIHSDGTVKRAGQQTCFDCIVRAEEYCIEVAMSFSDFDDVYWEFHEYCLGEL
ncbi:hypothetical protein FHT44_005183 [Mycolicibacterium sp. BK634]|uniref:hypothetical protein n=1 Tax=Mycolicibacterium sp. BK634 TaxID=2587099 RepID=UPI001608D885|nr:hypothetical protein [Mycolicibacterium sp. BK634]MBB3752671.1 hypothetical protein [Mycolicibacterium sp. BK634]